MHLQFAYFEASLVVQFLIEEYGFDVIVRTLDDVGRGLLLEDALPRHTAPMTVLDEQFAAYAKQKAEAFAPQVDWSQPTSAAELTGAGGIDAWLQDHPQSYFALQWQADQRVEAEDWVGAREILEQLVASCPEYASRQSPYAQLALVCQKMGDTERELAVLDHWVRRDGDALDALQRLIELAAERQDWQALRDYVERALAINPLAPEMYRHLAEAANHTGDMAAQVTAYGALLSLDPVDPAEVHYQLADRLAQQGKHEEARRHVLLSLEEAPRFRAAHKLLLRLVDSAPSAAAETPMEVAR